MSSAQYGSYKICALASTLAAPPPVTKLKSNVSPAVAALPIIHHCCVGAAFHLRMPPNVLSARLSLELVVVLSAIGPVVAATNDTATEPATSAVMFGFSPPSELGAASAVGVAATVDERLSTNAATCDEVS